jgi:hypothetical protein
MKASLRRFEDEIADGTALGPLRAVLGLLLGWHALALASELPRIGYFGDGFHMPMIPEVLVPSHRVYALTLAFRVCLAVMVTLGIWARPALLVSAALAGWALLSDRLQFHHNRYSLVCYALLLAFTPCDRSFCATDTGVATLREGPFWAVRLAQLQVSLVYLASGGAKLLDPDWRAGLVLGDRIARHADQAVLAGVPRAIVQTLARADVASALAKVAITMELLLVLGPWLERTRVPVLFCGVWFHLVIQLTSKVETFSVLTVAMYAVFVTPDRGARVVRFDPSATRGRLVAGAVVLLDWLQRFELRPWEPDAQRGHAVVVVRRDGTAATGIRAIAMLARCLPALFPLWAPLALVASFTKRGDLAPGA